MQAHPHAPDDTPAARGILGIVLLLLVVCSVIAVVIYKAYHRPEPDREQAAPTERSAVPQEAPLPLLSEL